ncbi:DNA-binding transcriptional MerR regulator [Lysinibacillus composti]|uniref:MerR family transcriptional regulator n=1 Tax=Lysinibacillus composti TaxID=720633 RepID=A0A3N9UW57_9BACI|nr:MerR family transcriptional regulator [Lysinibacillus composti]MBM7607341.1 DNA-binding transcriptional MerR regulator [Lysinibacillus composti]RQW76096.1 MerR family transcriptional regulator [Lysinibacillus composti]
MGGNNDGIEKLRIGEVAERTGITKRTIDYYTNIGLLDAERSASNYRYYSSDVITRLQTIEDMKAQGMTLEDIKKEFHKKIECEGIDIQEIRLHMQTLENEVSQLLKQIERQEKTSKEFIKNKISNESAALMKSLILLIT